jgi:hypothetical protein
MARGERVEGREVVVEVLKLAWERVHSLRIDELHPVDERSVIIVGVPATRQLAAALPIPALSGCATPLWTATPLGVPFLAHQPRTCCLFAPSGPRPGAEVSVAHDTRSSADCLLAGGTLNRFPAQAKVQRASGPMRNDSY